MTIGIISNRLQVAYTLISTPSGDSSRTQRVEAQRCQIFITLTILSPAPGKKQRHFLSVFMREDTDTLEELHTCTSQIRANKKQPEIQDTIYTFDEVHVHVFKILSQLDPAKASGPDGVPCRLLKEGATRVAEPLSIIFNLSLTLQFGTPTREKIHM